MSLASGRGDGKGLQKGIVAQRGPSCYRCGMTDAAARVYVSDAVAAIEALHGDLVSPAFRKFTIRDQLDRQARRLADAHADADPRVEFQIESWWPAAAGWSRGEVLAAPFGLDAARHTLAREYGYEGWAAVEALGDLRCDPVFERALDAMINGDIVALQKLLQDKPDLARARSAYGHRATLLHYLGANGVESHRQKTPLNAVALAELLVAQGADVSAEADMYGGGQTAFDLVVTSAHPAAAGVTDALAAVVAPPGK